MKECQKNLLKLISDPSINLTTRRLILKNCDSSTINSICEIILNILNGNIKLSEENYKKILPFANSCRKILSKKINVKEKKKILIQKGLQKGGFLQFIIPAVISGIATIVSSLISKSE